MKMIIRNHILSIGLAPMISEASSTVKGLVTALAKPKPQDTMQIRKPVKESYPIAKHSIVMIGSMVSISSNSPRNAPKHMNSSEISATISFRLLLKRSDTALTIAPMPPASFIT